MKSVAIIGAGPAGLSAAYELLRNSKEFQITIFEKEAEVGGLSKTFEFEGGRVDIGGHRFFSKNPDVMDFWKGILPDSDQGMLVRERVSHILWNSKLIRYPIQLDINTLKALGIFESIKVVSSYLTAKCRHRSICHLEDFYIDRFGRELYSVFFKGYTQKLWGIPADQIASDWGIQRVQKVSLWTLFLAMIGIDTNDERSIIPKYHYPAFGAGQLWEKLAEQVIALGGVIEKNCSVECLVMDGTRIKAVEYTRNNARITSDFDYVISSMPLRELAFSIDSTPMEVQDICKRLYYRDMVIVAIDVPMESLGTAFQKAHKDSWLYMQDGSVSFGRIQILNNWSPYAARSKNHVLLEMEYFCNMGDDLWETSDEKLVEQTLEELIRCSFCSTNATISAYLVKRIEKAYPVYTDGYFELDTVRQWVDCIDNLRCIGRNGQHRYNNMDHAVETGMAAAKSLMKENDNRSLIWNVNTDREYLEK